MPKLLPTILAGLLIWPSSRNRRHVMLGMTAIISSTGSSQAKLVNE